MTAYLDQLAPEFTKIFLGDVRATDLWFEGITCALEISTGNDRIPCCYP